MTIINNFKVLEEYADCEPYVYKYILIWHNGERYKIEAEFNLQNPTDRWFENTKYDDGLLYIKIRKCGINGEFIREVLYNIKVFWILLKDYWYYKKCFMKFVSNYLKKIKDKLEEVLEPGWLEKMINLFKEQKMKKEK